MAIAEKLSSTLSNFTTANGLLTANLRLKASEVYRKRFFHCQKIQRFTPSIPPAGNYEKFLMKKRG